MTMQREIYMKTEVYDKGVGEVLEIINDMKTQPRDLEPTAFTVNLSEDFDESHRYWISLAFALKQNLILLAFGRIYLIMVYDHTAVLPINIDHLLLSDKRATIHYFILTTVMENRHQDAKFLFKGYRLFFESKIQKQESTHVLISELSIGSGCLVYNDKTYAMPPVRSNDEVEYALNHSYDNVDKFSRSVLAVRLVDKKLMTYSNRFWNEMCYKDDIYDVFGNNCEIIEPYLFRSYLTLAKEKIELPIPATVKNEINIKNDPKKKTLPLSLFMGVSKMCLTEKDFTSIRRSLVIQGLTEKCFATLIKVVNITVANDGDIYDDFICGQVKVYLLLNPVGKQYLYITLEHADLVDGYSCGFLRYFERGDIDVDFSDQDQYLPCGFIHDFIKIFENKELFELIIGDLKDVIAHMYISNSNQIPHPLFKMSCFDFLMLFTPSTFIRESLPSTSHKFCTRARSYEIDCVRRLQKIERINPYFYRLPCGTVLKYSQTGLNLHRCMLMAYSNDEITCTETSYTCSQCQRAYCLALPSYSCHKFCRSPFLDCA